MRKKARKATRRPKERSAAVLTFRSADRMTDGGRHSIALWLRRQAAMLDREGDRYAGRFTARYLY